MTKKTNESRGLRIKTSNAQKERARTPVHQGQVSVELPEEEFQFLVPAEMMVAVEAVTELRALTFAHSRPLTAPASDPMSINEEFAELIAMGLPTMLRSVEGALRRVSEHPEYCERKIELNAAKEAIEAAIADLGMASFGAGTR